MYNDDDLKVWMDKWVEENVFFDGEPIDDAPDPAARKLATECLAQAQEDGISKEQLEERFGDIEMYMHQELVHKYNAKQDEWAA